MAQRARADAVDAHGELAGGVGTDGAAVGLHPVGGVIGALLGRQQRDDGLHGVETEVGAIRQRQLAPAQIETVAHIHVAGAVAFNAFNDDGEIVKGELVGGHK